MAALVSKTEGLREDGGHIQSSLQRDLSEINSLRNLASWFQPKLRQSQAPND